MGYIFGSLLKKSGQLNLTVQMPHGTVEKDANSSPLGSSKSKPIQDTKKLCYFSCTIPLVTDFSDLLGASGPQIFSSLLTNSSPETKPGYFKVTPGIIQL